MMPCAHADEMYSKCGVAPLIRQPRQTTRRHSPVSATAAPPAGSRTRRARACTSTSPSARPAVARAPRARRSSSRSVTKSLKRATTMRDAHVTSLPGRLALLEERRGAFLAVVGRGDGAEERGLEELALRERHVEPLIHRLDDVADGDRGFRGERLRQLRGRGHQLGGRHHLVDESDLVRARAPECDRRSAASRARVPLPTRRGSRWLPA